jgi:hypothetical protein
MKRYENATELDTGSLEASIAGAEAAAERETTAPQTKTRTQAGLVQWPSWHERAVTLCTKPTSYDWLDTAGPFVQNEF